ncbi:MAG: YqjF family protein [Actinomycetota bacterium]
MDSEDSRRAVGPVPVGVCPVPVGRAAMVHWWDELTFVHWRFRPDVVQRLLPTGLEVETIDGSAWVGLVPFVLRVGLAHVRRPVPWMSQFAETNVRTYVRSADGERGIWFFSLDAQRLGAVVVARATYRLPYFWSHMRCERTGATITYECRRRWPGPRGARSSAAVEIGDPYTQAELTELDHFLTARWVLYSAPLTGLHAARACHDPWPLHRAELTHVRDELIGAAGLPEPEGTPLVHFSPSVEVRIGWPRRIDTVR